MRFFYISILLVLTNLFSYSQYTINIQTNGFTDDTVYTCPGQAIDLSVIIDCSVTSLLVDFNLGTIPANWSSTIPMYSNPCLPSIDGSIYFWVGDSATFPRYLQTCILDLNPQDMLCFDMAYAVQGGTSPCEGPDMISEAVYLQYSTDSGATWVDINIWDPLGGYDPQMTTWNNYCVNIPTAAVTNHTMYRWYQDVTSGNTFDHWGLDNISILENHTDSVLWSNGFVGEQMPNFTLYNDSLFIVTLFSDSLIIHDSVWVEIFDTTNLSFIGLDSVYYINSPIDTLYGLPGGGYFNGQGINGSTFSPAIASAGTHIISYTYPIINTYSDTMYVVYWEDDFSTDKGWTGYGAGGWERSSLTSGGAATSGVANPLEDNTATSDNFLIGTFINTSYQNNMTQTYWLTSPLIDCVGLNTCIVDFFSHSGCESSSFDHIYFEVLDDTTWINIYSNGGSFSESVWTHYIYDISAHIIGNSNFQVRFGIGITDPSVSYKGWNIDDFKIRSDDFILISDTLCEITVYDTTNVLNIVSNNQLIETIETSIYPNPVNDIVSIRTNFEDYSVSIYSQLGQKVIEQQNATSIDIKSLRSGIYFIQVSDGKESVWRKLVVE